MSSDQEFPLAKTAWYFFLVILWFDISSPLLLPSGPKPVSKVFELSRLLFGVFRVTQEGKVTGTTNITDLLDLTSCCTLMIGIWIFQNRKDNFIRMIDFQIVPFQVISKNKIQRKLCKNFSFQELHLMKNVLKSIKLYVPSKSAEMKLLIHHVA